MREARDEQSAQRIEWGTEVRQRKQRKFRAGRNVVHRAINSTAVVIYDEDSGEEKRNIDGELEKNGGGTPKDG